MILLTGVPRSRTSMIAAIFEACGAYFGPKDKLVGKHPSNPMGFYEYQRVRGAIQRPYFEEIGFDPLCRETLPRKEDIWIDPDWRRKFLDLVGPDVNAYKEPKLSLYWEVWDNAFPEAKWVITCRSREEILKSVMERTSWMANAGLSREQWENWISHHLMRMKELMLSGAQHCVINSSGVVKGDYTQLRNCIEFCDLKWDLEKVESCILKKYTYQMKEDKIND